MSRITGIRFFEAASFSTKVVLRSAAGILPGFISDHTTTQPMNSVASRMPGSTPPMKSLEIDTSAATPYTIMMIEGGINRPSVPAPARVPSAIDSG